MKVLTGEAYWSFRRWIFDTQGIKPKFIDDLNEKLLHFYLIEWLDSVGINVYTIPIYHFGGLSFKSIIEGYDLNMEEFYFFKNRPQATEKGIKKAIEIYNQKHK